MKSNAACTITENPEGVVLMEDSGQVPRNTVLSSHKDNTNRVATVNAKETLV